MRLEHPVNAVFQLQSTKYCWQTEIVSSQRFVWFIFIPFRYRWTRLKRNAWSSRRARG